MKYWLLFSALLCFLDLGNTQVVTCEAKARPYGEPGNHPPLEIFIKVDGRWNVTGTSTHYFVSTAFRFFNGETEFQKRVPTDAATVTDTLSTYKIKTHYYPIDVSTIRITYTELPHQVALLHINSTRVTTFDITCSLKHLASAYNLHRRGGYAGLYFTRPVSHCNGSALTYIPNSWFTYTGEGANTTVLCTGGGLWPYKSSTMHFYCESALTTGHAFSFVNYTNVCDTVTGLASSIVVVSDESVATGMDLAADTTTMRMYSNTDRKGRIKGFVVAFSHPVLLTNFTAHINSFEFITDAIHLQSCSIETVQLHPTLFHFTCVPFEAKPSEIEYRLISSELYFDIPGTPTAAFPVVTAESGDGFGIIEEYDDLIARELDTAYLLDNETGIVCSLAAPAVATPHSNSFVVYFNSTLTFTVTGIVKLSANSFKLLVNTTGYTDLFMHHLQITTQARSQPLIHTEIFEVDNDPPVVAAVVVPDTDCNSFTCLASGFYALTIVGIVMSGIVAIGVIYAGYNMLSKSNTGTMFRNLRNI